MEHIRSIISRVPCKHIGLLMQPEMEKIDKKLNGHSLGTRKLARAL